MRKLEAQILSALTAYAETNGATIETALDGSKIVEFVVGQRLNLSEIAKVIAKEIS